MLVAFTGESPMIRSSVSCLCVGSLRLHGDREPRQAKVGTTGGTSYRSGSANEVWSYGPEVFEICKKYMQLCEELPDIYGKSHEASPRARYSLMRTMFYDFWRTLLAGKLKCNTCTGPSTYAALFSNKVRPK